MQAPETFHRDDAVTYAQCGPIWVMLMTGPPTEPGMRLAAPTLAKMKAANPSGFATLTWILPSAGMKMDGPARQAAADVTKAYLNEILSMANVVEVDGFLGATVRAVLSGLTLLSSVKCPQRTFASMGEAVTWLTTATPKLGFPPEAELVAELERLRRG